MVMFLLWIPATQFSRELRKILCGYPALIWSYAVSVHCLLSPFFVSFKKHKIVIKTS